MCRMCCPTVLPFTSEVTRRLLSQWPPLKSNLPSWETTNSPAVTSTPGAKGPDRKRWVLGEETRTSCDDRVTVLWVWCIACELLCVFSLGVGHSRVLNEGEVVRDVLVVRQPPMSPNQAVLTDRHLQSKHQTNITICHIFHSSNCDYYCEASRLTMVSGLPWVMKEWDWFFGTTALISGTLSLIPCDMTEEKIQMQVDVKENFPDVVGSGREVKPQRRRIWGRWGVQTCWEDTNPAESSSSPLPPATDAPDGAPVRSQTQSHFQVVSVLFVYVFKLHEFMHLVCLYLQQLAGCLSKVADHAFKSFTLLFISDGVQVHRSCNTKPITQSSPKL